MIDFVEAALLYKSWGLSVIPVDGNKQSTVYWQMYQRVLMIDRKIKSAFRRPGTAGIAIVCGPISGNLEPIDFDLQNDLTRTVWDQYRHRLIDRSGDVWDQLVIAQSRSHGKHLFYRSPQVEPSMVLARRLATPAELLIKPKMKAKVLIETRGKGGYIIVHPTPGYIFLQHHLNTIPIIASSTRDLLLTTARSFNECRTFKPTQPVVKSLHSDENRPLDAYDNDARHKQNVTELLLKHDWAYVEEVPPRTYFRRPGETTHRTSGDYHEGYRVFKVFTTSNIDFDPQNSYKPSAVFAILECDRNFSIAAKRLLAMGYGKPYSDRA